VNNLGAFPPMSTAGPTTKVPWPWPRYERPLARCSRPHSDQSEMLYLCDGKGYRRFVLFYDAPEELEHLVNSCYGLELETIA